MRKPNRLRIIGGQWRSRLIEFPDVAGLRPTPDAVRETLFNWLAPMIAGARCLDLFAGSGALGFEAASRGAGDVTMVERDRQAVTKLRAGIELLQARRVSVLQSDALAYLAGTPTAFDIVFLDPPYDHPALLARSVEALSPGWLAPRARIYMEHRAGTEAPALPPGWDILRSKRSGDVAYQLMQVSSPAP
jgi:16S rRNA (guanine966-N2)-methyltransferase